MSEVITMKGEPYQTPEIQPTNTRRFDGSCKKLWTEHGIIAFSFQDSRLSDLMRWLAIQFAEKFYGPRSTR